MRNGYVIVNNIQVSIILMYPVEGRYLEIPMKLKIPIRRCGESGGRLLGSEDKEDRRVDFNNKIKVGVRERGGHLADDEEDHGGQEGRHQAAGDGSAQSHLD